MLRPSFLSLGAAVLLMLPGLTHAQRVTPIESHIPQETSAAYFSSGGHTTAVDAKGARHYGRDYRGKPPWFTDIVKTVGPEYPNSERLSRNQGEAFVRLTLDLKTGADVVREF